VQKLLELGAKRTIQMPGEECGRQFVMFNNNLFEDFSHPCCMFLYKVVTGLWYGCQV
jgi:hypothetical protein